jgi:hypothetical protein
VLRLDRPPQGSVLAIEGSRGDRDVARVRGDADVGRAGGLVDRAGEGLLTRPAGVDHGQLLDVERLGERGGGVGEQARAGRDAGEARPSGRVVAVGLARRARLGEARVLVDRGDEDDPRPVEDRQLGPGAGGVVGADHPDGEGVGRDEPGVRGADRRVRSAGGRVGVVTFDEPHAVVPRRLLAVLDDQPDRVDHRLGLGLLRRPHRQVGVDPQPLRRGRRGSRSGGPGVPAGRGEGHDGGGEPRGQRGVAARAAHRRPLSRMPCREAGAAAYHAGAGSAGPRRSGGTGRRTGLKIRRVRARAGSIPAFGTCRSQRWSISWPPRRLACSRS